MIIDLKWQNHLKAGTVSDAKFETHYNITITSFHLSSGSSSEIHIQKAHFEWVVE